MPKRKRQKQSKSKTVYLHVCKLPSGRYQARIKKDGWYQSIGTFDTAKQAAKAYDKEAIKLRRPLTSLNYPKKAPVGYTPVQQPLRSTNTVGYRGYPNMGRSFLDISALVANLPTLVHTKQQRKQLLCTTVLFSKPTNAQLY